MTYVPPSTIRYKKDITHLLKEKPLSDPSLLFDCFGGERIRYAPRIPNYFYFNCAVCASFLQKRAHGRFQTKLLGIN